MGYTKDIQYVASITVPNNLSKAFLADDLDINKPTCSLGSNKKIMLFHLKRKLKKLFSSVNNNKEDCTLSKTNPQNSTAN